MKNIICTFVWGVFGIGWVWGALIGVTKSIEILSDPTLPRLIFGLIGIVTSIGCGIYFPMMAIIVIKTGQQNNWEE